MRMIDIISDKKYKKELSKESIDFFVKGVTDHTIPDYQISAFLMAVCLNGMCARESGDLAMAMADSGKKADLSSIKGTVVDKHSSGGVGDKCTLVIGPIVSSYGIPFAKLSGRGLGHTGGTIDKLASIKGFNTELSDDEFTKAANDSRIVIASQSDSLAPADKILYALRDVTATVDSKPLIASSIMSKKIASGAKNILLDIKCGNGAFMKNEDDAREIAKLMCGIGRHAGLNVKAFVTNMNQPLGRFIGNSKEVWEAYKTLSGQGPCDLTEICNALSAGMMELAGLGTYDECYEKAKESIENKSALVQFRKMVLCQGGELDEKGFPVLSDDTSIEHNIYSQSSGYIEITDTQSIGNASVILGAGRKNLEDEIDPGAGIVLYKKTGDKTTDGEKIATFYTNRKEEVKTAQELFLGSIEIKNDKPDSEETIIDIIDS